MEDPFHIISKITLTALMNFKKMQLASANVNFNCAVINLENILEFVENKLHEAKVKKQSIPKELCIIESGDGSSFSLDNDSDSTGVHYSVIEFQFNPDDTFYCSLLDAALINNKALIKKLSIPRLTRLFYASGFTIQQDAWSCPIFSLTHALALAETPIPYEKITVSAKNKIIPVPWIYRKPQRISLCSLQSKPNTISRYLIFLREIVCHRHWSLLPQGSRSHIPAKLSEIIISMNI